MGVLAAVADFGLEEILERGGTLREQIAEAEARLADALEQIPVNGGASPAAINAAVAAVNLLAAAARQSVTEANEALQAVEDAASSGGLVIGPDGPQFGPTLVGSNRKANIPRVYDPNATFGTGPYNYCKLENDPATVSTGGNLEMIRGGGSWWSVYRWVHNNATNNSGFWASEIWLPLFEVDQASTYLRWRRENVWSEFYTLWTSANLDVEGLITKGLKEPGNLVMQRHTIKTDHALVRTHIPAQSMVSNVSAQWPDYWKNLEEEWVFDAGRPGLKVGSTSGNGVWRVSSPRAFGIPPAGELLVSGWWLGLPAQLSQASDDLKIRIGFYGEFGSGDAAFLEIARDFSTPGNPLALWAASLKGGVFSRTKMAMPPSIFSIPRYVEVVRSAGGVCNIHLPNLELMAVPNPPMGLLAHGVRVDKSSSSSFVGATLYSHTVISQ